MKNYKKCILSAILLLVILFSLTVPAFANEGFVVENSVVLTSSEPDWWGCGVQYGRLLVLDDGTILATHCELNAGLEEYKPRYPIYKSTDNGNNWEIITYVTDTLTGANSEWNPYLFELEKDCGKYKKGTIILVGCSIDPEHKKESYIRLYFSTDGGYTFEQGVVVASGGGLEEGVWEPFLLQLDDGRIVCYYSDDSDPQYSQKIVYKTSSDLENWSESTDVVATKFFEERPGMPVVTRLGDGRYFMVYEVVDKKGVSGNPVYARYSSDGLDWGDPEFIGYEIINFNGTKALGSAPFCAWSPVGGENGTLIVSGTFMRKGKSNTGTDLFISNDNGDNWVTIQHVIPYIAENNVGYSNSIAFSKDGKYLYAINNPLIKDNSEKSEMVVAVVDFEKCISEIDITEMQGGSKTFIICVVGGVIILAAIIKGLVFVTKKRRKKK